jgi:hypothetical protein
MAFFQVERKLKPTPQPSEDKEEEADDHDDDDDVGPPPPGPAEKKKKRLRPVVNPACTSSDKTKKRTTTPNPATPDLKKQKTEIAATTNPNQAEGDDAPPSASKKQKLESLGAGRPMPASRRAALEQRMTVQVSESNPVLLFLSLLFLRS